MLLGDTLLLDTLEDASSYRQEVALSTTLHYTRLTALSPGLPRWVGTRKVKLMWILLKKETVSGSGISWAICKSVPRSRQITTPAPNHSVFLQARCPSCRPTNSVKALKAEVALSLNHYYLHIGWILCSNFWPSGSISWSTKVHITYLGGGSAIIIIIKICVGSCFPFLARSQAFWSEKSAFYFSDSILI